MMRRTSWLAVGVALGAGGTVWSSRRLARVSARARNGAIAGDLSRLVDRGSRRIGRRVVASVDAGRLEARRRQDELRRAVDPHAQLR